MKMSSERRGSKCQLCCKNVLSKMVRQSGSFFWPRMNALLQIISRNLLSTYIQLSLPNFRSLCINQNITDNLKLNVQEELYKLLLVYQFESSRDSRLETRNDRDKTQTAISTCCCLEVRIYTTSANQEIHCIHTDSKSVKF